MARINYILMLSLLLFCQISNANSLKSQLKNAEVVVQGRVMSKQSEWVDGQIMTLTHILVRDDLTAAVNGRAAKKNLVISQLGGTALHPQLNVSVSQHLSHQTTLNLGDEALYFTKSDGLGHHALLDGKASVIRIQGLGSDKPILPALTQLAVATHNQAAITTAGVEQKSRPHKAVLKQEALTLMNAKARIRKLLSERKDKGLGNEK
ncbi:MAG: hypothetical protein VX100_00740 [Pseudomonadota bacterium]|nr:hypothetical protein [Pseudomonadota bacterium]